MAPRRHVLVVDDERDLVELVAMNLNRSGYQTSVAVDGRAALQIASSRRFDLILLDLMLPELTGTEVAQRLRANPATAHVPIIMLTARGEEVDQLVGLALGADDYITKPFSVKVLLARIEAVLRRASTPRTESQRLTLGGVEINLETHDVTVGGEPIKLTLTEFRLLAALAQASGRVLSRSNLISRAIGPGITVTERTIDVHMTSIRKKLGSHADMIRTVRGVGYRAVADAESRD